MCIRLNTTLHCFIGEGNGNPLQYSCLENPRDRGACWAAVYGVAQSRTRLTRLSSSSTLFYIRDSSICGSWSLQESWDQSPQIQWMTVNAYVCLPVKWGKK